MSDERKNLRGSFDRPAWAVLRDSDAPRECVMREVWKTGARLRFLEPIEVPTDFVLHLDYDGRVARKCTVTAKAAEGCEVDVEFVARRVVISAAPLTGRDHREASRPVATTGDEPVLIG